MIHGIGRRTLTRLVKGGGLVAVGCVEALVFALARRVRWRTGATRAARGAGSIAGVFGLTYEEYRR
jgi:hypothetical protein